MLNKHKMMTNDKIKVKIRLYILYRYIMIISDKRFSEYLALHHELVSLVEDRRDEWKELKNLNRQIRRKKIYFATFNENIWLKLRIN